ncbi:zinc finger MYM-type protein 1-like [Belonocnema kinseyi]|uniref:zinc finger MYM-type protein 1-like n=1 Tax=Belonocnema kinseyi TaxID=2817044 RepID=UPI00143D6540|nr:zinc finger MYM-type protein 1-like [Belonocnema kinseyi]
MKHLMSVGVNNSRLKPDSFKTLEGDTIREDFLYFVPVEDVTGAGLANALLTTLEKLRVDTHFMKGQGYDGARAMSGEFKGCAAIVKKTCLEALYIHCTNHNLNLAITLACNITSILNCIETVKQVDNFFRLSRKAGNLLKNHILTANPGFKQTRLLTFCETPQFIIAFVVMKPVFSLTKNLSQNLQKEDCDLSACVHYVNDVYEEIKEMRTRADEKFAEMFKSANQISEKISTEITVHRRAGRQNNRENYNGNAEEYYQRSIFIPFLDKYLEELDARFLEHRALLSSIQNIIPAKCAELDEEEFNKTVHIFEEEYPNDVNGTTIYFWFQIYRFLQISGTLPVNVASSDRSFSTFRRLKTYLRIRAGEEQLNVLALLDIHRDVDVTSDRIMDILARKTRRIDITL